MLLVGAGLEINNLHAKVKYQAETRASKQIAEIPSWMCVVLFFFGYGSLNAFPTYPFETFSSKDHMILYGLSMPFFISPATSVR